MITMDEEIKQERLLELFLEGVEELIKSESLDTLKWDFTDG